MKKILCLLTLVTLVGCIGCKSKEASYNPSEAPTPLTINDEKFNPTDTTNIDINNISENTTSSLANTPCTEILNAPLSSGYFQVDNFLFKINGTSTVADIVETVTKENSNYYFCHYADKPLSLDDYAGTTTLLEIMDRTDKTHSLLYFQISEKYTREGTPTFGESVIQRIGIYDNYYCLSNGFTKNYKISEEELQTYFKNQGLTEGTSILDAKENTYVRSEKDGIPTYKVFVVSESNPDAIIVYYFNYKSKDTLSDCGIHLD